MTNDLNTLNGSLQQMIDELEENLQLMGVDAEYDPVTGIRGLIAQITDIEASIGGIDVVTNLSVNLSETSVIYGGSIVISGVLEADKDDTSSTNVDLEGYLKGATIKIYHGDSLVGTAITNQDGEYSYNYENISIAGTNNVYAVFEGTDNYETCTSENMSLTVGHNISLASNKQILSYTDSDDCTIIATYTGGSGATVQLYDEHDKLVTTMTDEGDGTYTYEYVSQGYGDRTFYAKTESLQSETYSISDIIKYDDCSTDKTSNYTEGSNATFTFDTDHYVMSTTTDDIVEVLNGVDNVQFEVLLKHNTNVGGIQIRQDPSNAQNGAVGLYNNASNTTYLALFPWQNITSRNNLTNNNDYYRYILTINSSSITATIETESGTPIFSGNTTKSLSAKHFCIFNVGSNTLNIKEIKIKPLSKPLELSSDNPILSYVDDETATITATHIGGDGYDVKLYDEFDDSLIATMTDEGDGTYTYEYTSRGIGDLEVYAKIGNYTSETFIISDYYLYDPVTSDKSYLYDTTHHKTTYGSNANVSLTYDSTNNYYIISNSTANSTGFVPINALTGLDNIRIEADVYINHNNSGVNLGFGLFEPSTGNNCQVFNIGNDNRPIDIFEGVDHLSSGTTTRKVWSKLIIEIRNKQLSVVLKNANGTTNVSTTYTMSLTRSNNTLFGISMYGSNNTLNAFLKNIEIKPIKGIQIDVDNPVLSFVDSTEENPQIATITAIVPSVIQGKTVKIYQDNVLVATETTDSQGQVSYEYESQGIGDVTFTFECMDLQEIFVVEDCTRYDTTEYTTRQDVQWAMPTGDFEVSADFYHTSDSNSYPQLYIGTELSVNNIAYGKIHNYKYGAEFKKNGSRLTMIETNANLSNNTYHTIKLTRIGDLYTVICDNGETLTYSNNTIPPTYLFIIYVPQSKIKNIKIKPL